jgi:hypothetical protein
MIVNNPPTLGKFFEDEREQAARRFLARYQFPAASNPSGIVAEHLDVQVAK